MTPEKLYFQIAEDLAAENPDVTLGKMMSSPGILYKSKNFAFFHCDEMTFKLGKDFDIESTGVKDWQFLQPFKNKGPMKAWYQIPHSESGHWDALAKLALQFIKDEIG